MYKHSVKRILDFVISLLALICIGWLLILLGILLYFFNDRSGVFFLQDRPGKDGRIFKVIKFKTMNEKRGPDGKLLPDLQRITKFGSFIRKTSLDELPQLINVLKGDMALIGPRPLLVQYLPLYSSEQMRRHEVRPGISGWAQVNGRNNLSWTDKFKLDVWYVDHLTFALDVRIVLMTIGKVFKRADINNQEARKRNITEANFNGYN